MTDKIEVVYTWIGPRGPIWNTELPNILSLADASEHAQVKSHKWWNDDNWRNLFSRMPENFEICPAFSIDIDDGRMFVVPFSLAWRVSFENYFCGETGLLEFAHMPCHLLPLIRMKNGYIFINHSMEAFMSHSYLNVLHGYFKGIHAIPLHKIIYLTGCINANEIYDDYCQFHGIPNDKNERLSIVPYPSAQYIFRNNLYLPENEPEYDENRVPEKLFLMWNRRYRPHRVSLALYLEEKDCIDRSYVSFASHDIERPTIPFQQTLSSTMVAQLCSDKIAHSTIERFTSKLPLVIDGETDINQMCEDRENASRPFCQNSLISIVTETNFEQTEVTLTEKSYKPIKEKHPFIIVGAAGALKGLHDAGFKTFSEFWDETYDTISAPNVRMEHIMRIIDDIATWDENRILDFRRRVKPILEHNFNLIKNSTPRNTLVKLNDIIRGNS